MSVADLLLRETCSTCRWWDPYHPWAPEVVRGDGQGYCKRIYAAESLVKLHGDASDVSLETSHSFSCSEHRVKEKADEAENSTAGGSS